jgi:hypothetical protein
MPSSTLVQPRYKLNITEPEEIKTVIGLTATGLLPAMKQLPQVGNNTEAYESLVLAG